MANQAVTLTTKEKVTVITTALLTSKRFWAGAIMVLASVFHLLWGITLDDNDKVVAVDHAVRYGAVAVDIIGALFLGWTKLYDDAKK